MTVTGCAEYLQKEPSVEASFSGDRVTGSTYYPLHCQIRIAGDLELSFNLSIMVEKSLIRACEGIYGTRDTSLEPDLKGCNCISVSIKSR